MLSVLAAQLLLDLHREAPVAWKHQKPFQCDVISLPVLIRLRRKPLSTELFVQCSESDCRYVQANEPPCPLTLGLFSEKEKSLR